MPRFEYQGRSKTGKAAMGVIDGVNESAVAIELIRGGTTPISIVPYVEKTPTFSKLTLFFNLDAPSAQDLSFLTRQMHSLVKAGVPIVRAVHVVQESCKNFKLKVALADVLATLEAGQSFGSALRKHPNIFPTLMTALVNVGENTGSLEEVFGQLSVHFERDIRTRNQIKAAIRYPVIVIIVISLAIVVINIFVIPAFAKFFGQFKATLPLPTRILIGVSDFFVNYWGLMLGVLLGIICGVNAYIRSTKGRRQWDILKLKIPMIGDIMKRAMLARFARSFALSMRTGVPLLESIGMIARATDNVYVSEQILLMRTYIEHGESLTLSAGKSEMFTPLILQMLGIGEETGEIDKLLDEVADYYEQEVDYDVKKLGDAIEPILIVMISGMVLLLALGIFLPMWDIWKVSLGK
ncbi:MAG TPA: type II secretion system F family protein [Gammaproteobacteria bacterium]|nr:type II secretion system F family protein [Gammaproteobacteria bacterium]